MRRFLGGRALTLIYAGNIVVSGRVQAYEMTFTDIRDLANTAAMDFFQPSDTGVARRQPTERRVGQHVGFPHAARATVPDAASAPRRATGWRVRPACVRASTRDAATSR